MSKLLRRPTRARSCFYCLTLQEPHDPRAFRCTSCACLNRYDANGEIMSDEPAMHDESMNVRSFAKRASPRKDRLPTIYSQGHGLFCHTCQTNQMLIANLLSNYLPSEKDPEYSRLLAQLPAYKASCETRYPPICASCLPAVEDEIKRRDNMARTSALGGFLQHSKGKGKQRQESVTRGQRELLERQLIMWRVRGILWVCSVLVVVSTYGAVLAGHKLPRIPPLLMGALPLLALLSIMWMAWDPTYASLRRSQLQGREIRQRGKQQYNILQLLAWLSRLITAILIAVPLHRPAWDLLHFHLYTQHETRYPTDTSSAPSLRSTSWWYFSVSLGLEVLILARSLTILRLDRPPAVRLMNQHSFRPSRSGSGSGSRQATPAIEPTPPDLFSSLTLSNKPVLPSHSHAHNSLGMMVSGAHVRPSTPSPIFGVPSLASAAHITSDTQDQAQMFDPFDDEDENPLADMDLDTDEKERDPNAMDWSPIAPATRERRYNSLGMIGSPPSHGSNQRQSAAVTGRWDDGSWLLRPQKFFVPEEPTGLEGLFAETITLADDRLSVREGAGGTGQNRWVTWVKKMGSGGNS